MIFNESKYNKDWDIKQLNQLGTFNRGKSRHRPRNDKKLFENGKYPLIQTAEVKSAILHIDECNQYYGDFGLSQSKMWDEGTLCITIAANIAETGILSKPMCFPDSVVGFIANKEASSELFMHYIFAYIKQAIQESVNGSIQDNINKEYLEQLEFRIPKKHIQDNIVELLSSIDEKIENNLRINKSLNKMMRMIFDYWFLQYDFPDAEGKPYKSFGGKMKKDKTGRREIPIDFEEHCIDDYVVISTEKITPNTMPDTIFYHYSIPEFDKTGSYGEELGITIQSDKSVVNENQILVSKLNPWFNRVVLPVAKENTISSTEFVVWDIENKYVRNFLYVVAQHDSFVDFCTDKATGTSNSHKRVPPETMVSYEFTANDKYIMRFGKEIDDYIKIIKNNIDENRELILIKNKILPLLMNGQLKLEK